MSQSRPLRWGILAPGEIAKAFGRDILLDPSTRGVNNISHTIVAAGSSSSKERAQAYLDAINAAPDAKAYGSYAELVADEEVEIVYIASPHSHHFQHAMLCLMAGKHILVEKPIIVNAVQLEKLMSVAKEKKLFLMEAAWTRYMPSTLHVREVIDSGKIGTVYRVFADLSIHLPPNTLPDDHRLLSPDLAGGVLLDIGVYALTWAFIALYKGADVTLASSAVEKYHTGVDSQTSLVLRFAKTGEAEPVAHAIVTTSMLAPSPKDENALGVRIQGSKGEVQIFQPIFRPERSLVVLTDGSIIEEKEWKQPGPGKESGWKNGFQNEFGGGFHEEGEGHGMFWEADECARALSEGRMESSLHPLTESLALMRVVDQVRRVHGIRFPEKVESAAYVRE